MKLSTQSLIDKLKWKCLVLVVEEKEAPKYSEKSRIQNLRYIYEKRIELLEHLIVLTKETHANRTSD